MTINFVMIDKKGGFNMGLASSKPKNFWELNTMSNSGSAEDTDLTIYEKRLDELMALIQSRELGALDAIIVLNTFKMLKSELVALSGKAHLLSEEDKKRLEKLLSKVSGNPSSQESQAFRP
jgi:hypothetical protein